MEGAKVIETKRGTHGGTTSLSYKLKLTLNKTATLYFNTAQKYIAFLVDKKEVKTPINGLNDIFNFKYSFEQLCKYVDVHLSNTGLRENKSFDSVLSFERFITVNVINRKINMTVLDMRKEWDDWVDRPWLVFNLLFIDDTIYQTHRWALNATISEINRKYWRTLFEVDDWGIIWYMCDSRSNWKHMGEDNQFMADMFWRIVSVLPWNITSNNHSLIKIDWV